MIDAPLRAPARLLFRSALVIFVVTIVIGILNGLDLWQPSHELLLTHVHAGTLGWITLAVIGVAMLVFGGEGDERSATVLAQVMLGATVLYVLTFATTTGILRPITGTLMLAAIVYALVWATRRRSLARRSVPALGLYLALWSLLIGAVLGVLLGLFIANGSIPGLDDEMARNLAGAHPPAMLAGYLILAGLSIAEWRLESPPALTSESRPGTVTVWMLFVAGLLFNVAIIWEIEPLLQVASLLQVIAVVVFVVRMWGHLKPAAWRIDGPILFARFSVVFLVVGIALLVVLVQKFASGELDPESPDAAYLLLSFDHALFLGLMTNALLSITALELVWDRVQRILVWSINVGLAGFLIGLVTESSPLKRVFSAVMGVALLGAVWTHVTARGAERATVP